MSETAPPTPTEPKTEEKHEIASEATVTVRAAMIHYAVCHIAVTMEDIGQAARGAS